METPLLRWRNSQTHGRSVGSRDKSPFRCPRAPSPGTGGGQSGTPGRAARRPRPEQDAATDDPGAPWHLRKALAASSPVLTSCFSCRGPVVFQNACLLPGPPLPADSGLSSLHASGSNILQRARACVSVCVPKTLPRGRGSRFFLHLPLHQPLPGCGGTEPNSKAKEDALRPREGSVKGSDDGVKGARAALLFRRRRSNSAPPPQGVFWERPRSGKGLCGSAGHGLGRDPPFLPPRGSLAKESDRRSGHAEGLHKGNSVATEVT